jgi:hypothetical protein
MNYRKLCRLLLGCVVITLLTNCGNSPISQAIITPSPIPAEPINWEEKYLLPNQWDGGLFSEKPCRAPCFAGIVPGSTVESELIGVIENDEHFRDCRLEARPDQGRWIACNGLIIDINKVNSIVDSIGFNTSQEFSIEDVMSKYGEPTMTWVAPMGIPEAPEVSMVVFWEAEKIRINLEDQEGVSYQLAPSTLVTNIVYYSETNDGFTIFFQPWHSYGEYIVDND